MAELTTRGLKKRFGTTDVLHGIDVTIPDQTFCVVVGPSGCGKSTFLRCVAGLEHASEGEIRIGGRLVNEVEPKDRDIAMVFQNYALYPHMTVAQNMAFGLELRGMSKAERRVKVEEAAGILQLDGLLDRKPRQLSGGQRQRVAMGRAIVRDPALFLFDEPLSNLDAKLRVEMRLEIKRLHRELGATSLYVTHDQIEAMTMGDLLIVLNEGRVEQIGPPLDVYERPNSTFVASFIGSPPMNFIPAELRGGMLHIGEHAISTQMAKDGPVKVGIRPEHLSVSSGSSGLPVTIDDIEPQGAETLLYSRFQETSIVIRQPGKVHHDGSTGALSMDPAHLHLFDARSGRRLETALAHS
ncbi:MAG: sn-glycerol-3-phosphate ABC transporter ATP-binding protein UgpC [Pseudomonadota bacterium]